MVLVSWMSIFWVSAYEITESELRLIANVLKNKAIFSYLPPLKLNFTLQNNYKWKLLSIQAIIIF